MADNKTGRWTKEDELFVAHNFKTMTVEEIAKRLKRDVRTVRAYIKKKLAKPPKAKAKEASQAEAKKKAKSYLRNSMEWKLLEEEFDKKELSYFEEKYIEYVSQFKDDVLPTENTQIFMVIKLEILIHRTGVQKRKAEEELKLLIKMLEEYEEQHEGDYSSEVMNFIMQLQNQIQSARSNEQAKTREYNDTAAKHQALMKDLKATRDQRFNKVENSKDMWLKIIKDLCKEEERERYGRQMELMRVVSEKEADRLGSPHEYEDGVTDLPLLSPETIEKLDEQG